ncbi:MULTISPECIES: hypothetical protein [Streptomyces]|uniref:Phage portal protein n=1 Tax=Streptomyces dengpaensis TaxID=2049881 RepID=A0ABN5HWU6_9ACTN|nr:MULTISPECIES: hypothetical protein [Streptomyces]AVH55615.1 hypothetical protein C4B68_07265 [Streptomyces dengpaensis]PIB11877.1 hypothetical protein B1C81_01225 [Streptomyces sp. HG99]
MADALFDHEDPEDIDDADPTLIAVHGWNVAEPKKAKTRVTKLRKLIDAGAVHLHPDHLDWTRFILNWAEVDRTLPTYSPKTGRYRDRVRPMRLGEYRVYCLDLLMPTVTTVQQLMNYRTRQGRSLRDVPDTFRPVSRSHPLLDGHGVPVVGVTHTYVTAEGLLNELRTASQKVRESRQRERGWEPLHDAVLSDGVEDGGLWLQTVFAPLGDDGEPDWTRAVSTLAPADAASRKAVCDSRVDPDGMLAALPLLKPRRSDVFDGTEKDPSAVVSVTEAVSVQLGRVKTAVSGIDFVDDLPDEARELLHATVMPVRLAYRVTDSRGRDIRLDGPALFRSIQKHFHGPEHLGHPPAEAERLVADDTYAALRQAIEEGKFETPTAVSGPAALTWSVPLLDAVCSGEPLDALAELGLPTTWQGRVAAAVMLVFGDGPERAIIGRVLKSRPQGGLYNDRLDERRLSLLREWTFGETPVNRRAFEQIEAKAVFEDPLRSWNGNTDELVELVCAGQATPTETALFEVLATTAAGRNGMQIVDIGSAQQARGFASVKAYQALRGRLVRTAPGADATLEFVQCGPAYMRALLKDQLLLKDPQPRSIGGLTPEAPTDADWRIWSANKIGALNEDGAPAASRSVRAAMTGDSELIQDPDGTVRYHMIDVPQLVPDNFLDQFSTQALTRRAKDRQASAENREQERPLTADERVGEALDAAVKLLPALGSEVGKLEGLQAGGHLFDVSQRSRLTELALDVRGAGQHDQKAIAGRIDTIVRNARDQESQLVQVQEMIEDGNHAAAADHDDGEDGENPAELLLASKDAG